MALLNYEFDRQLELERADAIEEGENKMLFTLVTKGKLDIDTAAEEAGVSVSEFEKLMSEAGYKVPETVQHQAGIIYQNVNSKNPLTIVFGIADFLCRKVSHPTVIVLRYCIGTA